MKIAVAGGTGAAGKAVVSAARAAGHETVVLARSAGVDLTSGDRLDLTGVDAVVDVSNITTTSYDKARDFFEAVTSHLLRAGALAGVKHHVTLSIVGIDRVPLGYYRAKQAQEARLRAGEVPWTVLRTTQFHDFAAQLLARTGIGPVAAVPHMRMQPVSAEEVGAELVRLALGDPLGMAPELAGPREEDVLDLARRWVRARGKRTLVVPVPVPGAYGKAIRRGGLIPTGPYTRALITYDEWLRG